MRLRQFSPILSILLLLSSCKVDFSPNAEWKDVPSVYCVIDPEEDTIFARVQRCYLGEDNLYNYATIADSTNYPYGALTVKILVWKGQRNSNNDIVRAQPLKLLHQWEMCYTERSRMPNGHFASTPQPLYYYPVGAKNLLADTASVFQLVVLRNSDGDTLAQAFTTLVGLLELKPVTPRGDKYVESTIILLPNNDIVGEFGYACGCRGEIKWNTLPRGRLYQPTLTYSYRSRTDTFSVDVKGSTVLNSRRSSTLSTTSITQSRLLSAVQNERAGKHDTLFFINNVDISLAVCNEDLNAYINSQHINSTSGQQTNTYTNIQGGVGIFGSRRGHIRVNVPCDSNGNAQNLPMALVNLGVGFRGNFGE